jgi:heterodisulfide reductase subunit A-like polyferredoxin
MKKSKFITDFKDVPTPREKMPDLPLEERKENFREVELGLEEERAIRESKRCLSCRRCIGCGLCLAECDPRAVVYDEKGRSLSLKVSAIVLTPGFDEFDAGIIRELGYRQFPNVVTSIELERMLSPTGPYGGLVLRPYDGDVPTRIAFVQCVGSRDEALGADYCSSVCCMSAMKEALSLVGQIGDARVKILHRDMRPLGKGSEEFYQSVLKEPRVDLVPAAVARIEELPESKNLLVEFSALRSGAGSSAGSGSGSSASPRASSSVSRGAGSSAESTVREEYDLVVLSVGLRPSSTARALSRQTGVRLNKYGFCLTSTLTPTLTSKAGIAAAGAFVGPGDIEQSVCQADAAAAVALRNIKGELLEALPQGISSSVLVIGSGVAGLTAALELSRLGHKVTVIEKEREPGGIASRFPLLLTARPDKGGPPGKGASADKSSSSQKGSSSDKIASDETVISSLLRAIEATGKITILKSTQLSRFSGEPGCFSVGLRSEAGEKETTFGAVVVCTGGKEYVPEGFFYGKEKRVVTQLEFERILSDGGFQASSVAMIQCVGSRSADWPVCARTCCEQALRNALKVKELKPETNVTILHRDIRVYFVEEELFSEAKEKGVEFVALENSASPPASGSYVTVTAGEKIGLAFERQASGARETISADSVVLSTGFRPHPGVVELARTLGIEIDDKGFFSEIHSKLRPVESSRKGVYICGLAHSPQNVSETIAQAMAAAKKASTALNKLAADSAG